MNDIEVANVRIEHSRTGRAPVPAPRVSWRTTTERRGWRQERAELCLTRRGGVTTTTLVTRESVLVAWPFDDLSSGEQAELRIRVTGEDGSTSGWSEPTVINAIFLAEGAWAASMIRLADPSTRAQPALLRSVFHVDGPVARATLYSTGLGSYQVQLNGADIDDHLLKPGWTAYQARLIHESTDVSNFIRDGANAIGARIAGAWYTEEFCWPGGFHPLYGAQPAFAAQLEIEYADGRRTTIATDESWRATAAGPLRESGLYNGEYYDARMVCRGWSSAGYDDADWPLAVSTGSEITPAARVGPPVRAIQKVPVHAVLTTPAGHTVLDFGQNLVGRIRFTVTGEPGHRVTIRHAEVLESGELCTRPLRTAKAEDHYVLAGGAPETWEPEFTFHGFRYAQIDNWPGPVDPADFTAVVVHSDMERVGWFESSHPLVNQLHDNVVWSTKGNFLSIPTDCPQRNERLGWTGDIQVFAPSASFLFDCNGFLDSWLSDLAIEQAENGGVVPNVIPNVFGSQPVPTAGWGDAATVVPLVLHERFGDVGVVERQYASMRAWADVVLGRSNDGLWEGDFQFGDWLDPDAPPEKPENSKTSSDLMATAHLARALDHVGAAAALLERTEDELKYRALAETVRATFRRTYVTPAGRLMSDSPAAYAVAICFDLFDDDDVRAAFGRRLASLVERGGCKIPTGFIGTPIIQDALVATGHGDVAERLLLQTECPSWLYPVTMGATSIWERWDSMRPDGTVNTGGMTSFNHYALGAVSDWLHRVLAGLSPADAGYREIRIEPHPMPSFDSASARHVTPYGVAESSWSRDPGGAINVRAVVPPNTDAIVKLPGWHDSVRVGSGAHEWNIPAELPSRA